MLSALRRDDRGNLGMAYPEVQPCSGGNLWGDVSI